MDWRHVPGSRSVQELRDLVVSAAGVALLILAAIVLSAPPPKTSVATPLGVSQGQADYSGGYPSPLSCPINSSLCYPYLRIGTLSVHPPGGSGQTVNVYSNGATDSIGSAVSFPDSTNRQVVVEWACQPSQTATQTCTNAFQCGCNWWGGCGWCVYYYECGPGTATYADRANGVGFNTGSAIIGNTTVAFPNGYTSNTYTLTCVKDAGGSWSVGATVYATAPPPPPGGTPPTTFASISASPQTVSWGNSSAVTWVSSQNAAQCSITPALQ